MTFQVSPGVYPREIDNTIGIPNPGAAVGAFAGQFSWGPVEQPVLTVSDDDIITKFARPTAQNQIDFLVATSYLAYAGQLYVARVYDQAALNATTGDGATPGAGAGLLVKNDDHYTTLTIGDSVDWIARFPGELGNSLRVYVVAGTAGFNDIAVKVAATTGTEKLVYETIQASVGRRAPSTTPSVAAAGGSNDELHVFVFDYNGKFTGRRGTLLESFTGVSFASDAISSDNQPNYYVDVINQRSRYIRWGSHSVQYSADVGEESTGVDFSTSVVGVISYPFAGGTSGDPVGDDDYIAAYDLYENAQTISVSYIIMGQQTSVPTLHAIQNIAESREDCVVFASVPNSAVVNAANPLNGCLAYRDVSLVQGSSETDTLGGYSSSYAFLDCNWKYMFNKYLNTYAWVPTCGDTAGLTAATAENRDRWFSPAGFNRGAIRNSIRLAWIPNEAQRDALYSAEINPIVSFPGRGTFLYGDKTLLSAPSAFQQIGVRFLFIVVRTLISEAANFSLFEFNDQYTRAQFVAQVEPFLRDIQGRRGIEDFRVVCDATNNTPQVINSKSFIGDIYIIPALSINWIQLNFIAEPSGFDFSTIGA